MNTLLWSAYVNLLANGVTAANARTALTPMIQQDSADQTASVARMVALEAAMITQAGLAVSSRAAWYVPNSYGQLGAHL
jgi:hypothetical protein